MVHNTNREWLRLKNKIVTLYAFSQVESTKEVESVCSSRDMSPINWLQSITYNIAIQYTIVWADHLWTHGQWEAMAYCPWTASQRLCHMVLVLPNPSAEATERNCSHLSRSQNHKWINLKAGIVCLHQEKQEVEDLLVHNLLLNYMEFGF